MHVPALLGAADRANGCEKQVKTRPKPKTKPTSAATTDANQSQTNNASSATPSGANPSNGKASSATPSTVNASTGKTTSAKTTSAKGARPTNPNEGTQGGVLKKKADQTKVVNTPLESVNRSIGGCGLRIVARDKGCYWMQKYLPAAELKFA
ncbi:hypothetical protein POM88_050939 [Heracleum sosnowskyi]|uniref:Uncharacterized protein n=1 Tax=Heracleum sosnowskyi TaxID=360622 RepID=A0AAD8GZQ0_9APIA|nr:hypothetical protein POM88_050939 [Heracleum sosnowskyi]